jgi:hypothetical protein
MSAKPFPMSVQGAVITIKVPALEKVQLHHPIFPPVPTRPLHLIAYFSPVEIDLGEQTFKPSGGFWVLTPQDTPNRFQCLAPKAMLDLVNTALASQWEVKGYEPNEYPPTKNEQTQDQQ